MAACISCVFITVYSKEIGPFSKVCAISFLLLQFAPDMRIIKSIHIFFVDENDFFWKPGRCLCSYSLYFVIQGTVLQMYMASCSGGNEADIASVQCDAHPLNCDPSPLTQQSLTNLITAAAQAQVSCLSIIG